MKETEFTDTYYANERKHHCRNQRQNCAPYTYQHISQQYDVNKKGVFIYLGGFNYDLQVGKHSTRQS
jgi:hypothetical protein